MAEVKLFGFEETAVFPVKELSGCVTNYLFRFLNHGDFEQTKVVSKKWNQVTKDIYKIIPGVQKIKALFNAKMQSQLLNLPGFSSANRIGMISMMPLCIEGDRIIFQSESNQHLAMHSGEFYRKLEDHSNLLTQALGINETLFPLYQNRDVIVHAVSSLSIGRPHQCEIVVHHSNFSRIIEVPSTCRKPSQAQSFVPITKDIVLISYNTGEAALWDIRGEVAERIVHMPGHEWDKWHRCKNYLIRIRDNDFRHTRKGMRKCLLQRFDFNLNPVGPEKALNQLVRSENTPYLVECVSHETPIPSLNCYIKHDDGSLKKEGVIDPSQFFSKFDIHKSVLVKNWLVLSGVNDRLINSLIVFDLNMKNKEVLQVTHKDSMPLYSWNLNEDILFVKNAFQWMNEITRLPHYEDTAFHLPTQQAFIIDRTDLNLSLVNAKVSGNSLVILQEDERTNRIYASMGRLGILPVAPPDPVRIVEPVQQNLGILPNCVIC